MGGCVDRAAGRCRCGSRCARPRDSTRQRIEPGRRAGHRIVRAGIIGALAAAATAIVERSGAAPGDKSILDALLRIERDLKAKEGEDRLLDTAIAAASAAIDEFRGRESRIGRARIYGSKSIGLDDPGMLAALMLLSSCAAGATLQRPEE
jgi:hypothetical protein